VHVAITSAPEFLSVRPAKENSWMLQLLNEQGCPDTSVPRGALLGQLRVRESPIVIKGWLAGRRARPRRWVGEGGLVCLPVSLGGTHASGRGSAESLCAG